jgi:hypothetical protein
MTDGVQQPVTQTPTFKVTEQGETVKACLETIGYGVARQSADGQWLPTPIFFPDKSSADEALAEMQKIGEEVKD